MQISIEIVQIKEMECYCPVLKCYLEKYSWKDPQLFQSPPTLSPKDKLKPKATHINDITPREIKL